MAIVDLTITSVNQVNTEIKNMHGEWSWSIIGTL